MTPVTGSAQNSVERPPLALPASTASAAPLLGRLAQVFFRVVPLSLRTHCLLTSRIVHAVLEEFGVESALLPCQLVCAQPTRQIVIGFTGALGALPNRWDGHVVCVAEGCVIDAATYAFEERFGVHSPHFVVVSRVEGVRTHVIARIGLSEGISIWWLTPPVASDIELPASAMDDVDFWARRLVHALRAGGDANPQGD